MKKILIIEDEGDTAKILKRRAEDWGYEAVVAYDSQTGEDLAISEEPDLILLDLMLPPKGGETVLASIRARSSFQVPVIVITGVDDDACRSMIEKMGVSAYFNKPYDPQALRLAISAAVEQGEE